MINIYEFFSSDKPFVKYKISKKQVFNSKTYIINEQLGSGGESYVLSIQEDLEDSKEYAIKIAKKNNIKNKKGNIVKKNEKFAKEITIAKEFSSDEYKNNFITYIFSDNLEFNLLDKKNNPTGKTTNHSFYVMDIAEQSFEDYLCNNLKWSSGDDENNILPQIRQLAETVKLLHSKNYVHRDIKPQNILVHGEVLKLADFGMVEEENTSCTKTGPKYWPTPELLEMCDDNAHCSGKQTDVFMLGCIFYFIYTKKYPVGNVNIDLILDKYKMKSIIKKMISYDIDERYKNCDEVYDEIRAIRFDT